MIALKSGRREAEGGRRCAVTFGAMGAKVRRVALAMLLLAAAGTAYLLFAGDGIDSVMRRLPPSVSARLGIAAPPQLNTCPVCLQTLPFIPSGTPPRPLALCPYCGSLERHRLLYLYLRQKTNLFRDQLSVLHFSPERGLGAALKSQRNLTYATSWYEPDREADYHLDLTNLALPDNSWDVMLVYHIFEHIPDDRQAMRELFRVLKPGGWAAVQVPIREEPDTYEDASVVTEQDRTEKFGQFDHLRFYGWKDFGDRLAQAGFAVTIERFGHELSESAVREFALDRNERIYLVRKPPA